jgi:kinesin family member 20
LSAVLGPQVEDASDVDSDPTILKVDRNHEYTIWISYAEVYNEKVYDLLDSLNDESDFNAMHGKGAKSLVLARTALPLKPCPVTDNENLECHGKYIAGLRQFRVHTAAQAKAIIKLGQLHRRVFGTLANRESSRSHGIVIIKVVRGHKGERDVCFLYPIE